MNINYVGRSPRYKYRIAEFCYDDENNKDYTLAFRIFNFLEKVHGYKVDTSVDGWACIEISDMEEYNDLKSIYLEAKRMFQKCMKYGF